MWLFKPWKWKPLMWLIVLIALLVIFVGIPVIQGHPDEIVFVKWMKNPPSMPQLPSLPLPVAQATQAPIVPGQPTTIRPTVSTGGQTVPSVLPTATVVVPTFAPPPANALEVQVGIVNYSPYHDIIGAAALTGPANGSKIVIFDLSGAEEKQCDWVQNRKTSEYFPPLSASELKDSRWQPAATNVPRVLFSTHSSAMLCPGTDIKLWIGQSAGNDVIVGRSNVKTINDICLKPIASTAFGSVSEGFVKTLCKAAGLTVADLKPADDAEPARDYWRANPSIPSVVLWEPIATTAVDCKNYAGDCVQGAEYKLTSKVFYGVFDVWMSLKTNDVSEALARAMISTYQFQDFAFQDPNKAFATVIAYAKQNPGAAGALKDYNTVDDWMADRQGEAQLTWRDNLTLATVGIDFPRQRIREIQDIFRPTYLPTYKRGATKPFEVPNVSPDSLWDTRYIVKIKDDPRLQKLNAQPATRPMLAQYAPPGDKSSVMLKYDYLDVKFQTGTSQLVDAIRAQDELSIKVVPILRLTPFVFSINYAPDTVGQARAQIVQNILTSILGVPVNRVILSPVSGSNGAIDFTLMGSSGS